MADTVVLRRAVSSLDRTGGIPQELSDYAAGIREMRSRPASDPLSWQYQSTIHGRDWLNGRNRPNNHPRDWDWCQHAHWLFLPWHRMYLLQFERILGRLIQKPEWRLPYWDYDHDDASRWAIPTEFLAQGSDLYETRSISTLAAKDRDPIKALQSEWFIAPDPTQSAGFGGAPVKSPVQHGGGTGQLESVPHNAVHREVGGRMGHPITAALDPLFWLHHANIDRLWERWRVVPGHRLPDDSAWLDTEFDFPDPVEPMGRRTLKVRDILDIRSVGYAYDDVAPVSVERPVGIAKEGPVKDQLLMSEELGPELIGATSAAIELEAAMTHVVRLQEPSQWRMTELLGLMEGADSPEVLEERALDAAIAGRVFLQLEGVRATNIPEATYDVYLNLSLGETPTDRPDLYAGSYAPFALAETTEAGGSETVGFDITDIVDRLRVGLAWDSSSLQVTFVPRTGDRFNPGGGGDLSVERIGLYVLRKPAS